MRKIRIHIYLNRTKVNFDLDRVEAMSFVRDYKRTFPNDHIVVERIQNAGQETCQRVA